MFLPIGLLGKILKEDSIEFFPLLFISKDLHLIDE